MTQTAEEQAAQPVQPADIVIVGGGPVGCWTALQIKKRNPAARITVYERKEVYERDHVLSIGKASFLQWSKNSDDNAGFLKSIFNAQATCSIASGLHAGGTKPAIDLGALPASKFSYWRNLPKVLDIRTIDFERILKEECEKSGVNFVYKKIETPEEIMDLHPECACFIAADGANSKMRGALWGADSVWKRDIYPSLDFKYASEGQPGYLRVNTYDKLGHVYAENIGLEKDGKSDINLRIIVSKAEYDAIPAATFKKPLTVTPDSPFWAGNGPSRLYGRTLKQDFYDLQDLRREYAKERPTDAPVTMTKIYLSQYCAKKFAKTVERNGQKKSWFLVGDAAMGMPFYRSVNSGLILGSQLGYLLTSRLVAEAAKTAVYNYYTRPCRILREFARVAKTEARIMLYKNIFRPVFFKISQTPAAPLVRKPLDFALKHLKYGKTS
ncbi:MAG: FAD-dependent oxidoreductase [Alphaproteobacteria bacterium]|nr:MAG: FAD-dependent oxidoreductase [Alphaproteobacteria bacterium]